MERDRLCDGVRSERDREADDAEHAEEPGGDEHADVESARLIR